MGRKAPKCSMGFPCGKTCISRTRNCWANLSTKDSRVAETFSQFVNRLVGIGELNNSNTTKAPLRNDLAELEKNSTKNLTEKEIGIVKENLKMILSGRKVALNFFEDSLGLLLDSGGKFKNQFEIGDSMGEYNPELRMEIEERINGLNPETLPSDRPKYGHLVNDEYNANDKDYEAFSYGAIRFIFNDSVKDKTTYTFGDSLINEGVIANSLDDPSLGVFTEKQLQKLASLNPEDLKDLSHKELQKIIEDSLEIDFAYIEAQIHGNLSLNDVASVDIPSYMSDSPDVERLKQEYPGIKINFYDEGKKLKIIDFIDFEDF